MNLDELDLLVRNSVFNKNYYSVDIGLKGFIRNIMRYTNYELSDNITEKDYHKLFDAVPKFQRDNNKWTKKMKKYRSHKIVEAAKIKAIQAKSNLSPL